VGPDLHVSILDEAEAGELLHGVQDRMGMAEGEPVHAGAVVRVVGQVIGPAGQHHGAAGVGEQQTYRHGGGLDQADADLIQGFLDDSVQRLPGEAGEVDGDVLAGEGLLDERTQAD
jgi:hypothetical protein